MIDPLNLADIIILALMAIPCIIGNSLVITAIIKYEYLQSKTNLFVLALSMADLTCGLIATPVTTVMRNIDSNIISNSSYPIWKVSCIAGSFFQHLSAMGDMLSIAAITLDRFLYINYPLKYETIMTRRVAATIFTGIIVGSLGLTFLAILGSDVLEKGLFCTVFNVLEPISVNTIWMPLFGLVSLMVIVFYGKIAQAALSKEKQDMSQFSNAKSQKKVTKVMSIVIGIFVSTYGAWFAVYFATAGIQGQAMRIFQGFVIWFWAVSKHNFFQFLPPPLLGSSGDEI